MAAGEQPTLFSVPSTPVDGDTGPASTGTEPAVLLAHHGAEARDALWRLVEAAQRDDPLAPVTIAVPSPYAGLSLRRALGARGGFVNVHFVALARVAELLGAPALAATGRRPLAGPLRSEAVHAALLDDPGPFAAVAEHPSTAARLAATFRDLRRARLEPPLRALHGLGARAEAVARLYADVRRRTSAYYDEEDLLEEAAAAIAAGGTVATEVGRIIVFTPTTLSGAEVAFVRGLIETGHASVVLGLTGEDDTDDQHARALAVALGAVAAAPPEGGGTAPRGTRTLAAPDPDDEARAVARRIVTAAEHGTPLHELAVLYRLDEPYARILPEVLDEAGIAWNGPSPRRLSESIVARTLLALLELADGDLARDDVAAWLASGPIRDADGHRVPAARWDVVSRQAGVVTGAGQWHERLASHRAELERTRALELAADDRAWRINRLDGDLRALDALTSFITELAQRCAAPASSTWRAHVEWASALTTRYLGTDAARGQWPEPELDAGRRVQRALDGLIALDELGAAVDVGRFRRALAAELDVPFGRVARFGTGVFVGPLRSAYGTAFSHIFVLGMAQGTFPPRGREDPLLPDSDRRALVGLSLHADRQGEERRDYLAALATAPSRTLCFARVDPRAQRKRLPARWLLETASALAGVDIGADDLFRLGTTPWHDVVESFAAGVTSDAEPVSVAELDLRSLDEWRGASLPMGEHPLAVGALGAGFGLIEARASGRLTAFDGGIGTVPGLAPGVAHAISPSALQDWARCPFRYLLARVLRIRDVPKPEATDTITALDEGTLVHEILETFLSRAPARARPDQPWDDADRALLASITEEALADAERRGLTGRPLHWRLAQRRIRAEVAQFTAIDESARARLGVVASVDGLEVDFGESGTPVVLDLTDGRRVSFRGRIDRVDRAPDGSRVIVYDYKTGSPGKVDPDDPVESGTRLQLPVYALAARARWGPADAQAFYWYTRALPDDALAEFPVGAGHHDRFVDVVTSIVDGVEHGCFVAYPGKRDWRPQTGDSFENCLFCPYDRICPPDRLGAWTRKESDDAVAPFHGLDLPEPEPADEPDGDDT